jgi:ribosomal-protein-serine acetyltransferase
MQQPDEAAVRASIERAETTERIVLDAAGAPVAVWRAAGGWALRRALAWAFEERGVHRMFLYVTAANARARALYERHGLRLEGTHRDGFRNPAGGYEGLCFYGILADDYREIR